MESGISSVSQPYYFETLMKHYEPLVEHYETTYQYNRKYTC